MSPAWLTALVTICVAASVLSTYECVERRRINGRFTTSVRIASDRPSPVRQVTWDTNGQAATVQAVVAKYSAGGRGPFWEFPHDPVQPSLDGIISIVGRAGGDESPFRILRNRWVYERFVILKIEFEDGTTVYRWAEVNLTDKSSVTVVHILADE